MDAALIIASPTLPASPWPKGHEVDDRAKLMTLYQLRRKPVLSLVEGTGVFLGRALCTSPQDCHARRVGLQAPASDIRKSIAGAPDQGTPSK